MNKVITRFPPSPTGKLHMGSARTALFNYLFAKHHGGKMLLRMEDTDKERSKKEYEEDIIEGLKWLGIEWEGDILRQSERTDVYKAKLKELIDKGLAYEAEENKDKTGRVVRFKNPNKVVEFEDALRGTIKVDTTELGDFVIARSLDDPLYHLAVVVDDAEMGVTHILRGEDGLSNTPRQILLQQALGYRTPFYVHIPFILGQDKSKLSKRHGAASVLEYKNKGYLKEAIINFLALLGWRSKKDDEKELWTIDELIEEFDLDGLQKSGAVFNEDKLKWINKEYLKRLDDNEFWDSLLNYVPDKLKEKLQSERVKKALLEDLKDRIHVYSEIEEMFENGEFNWLILDELDYSPEKLIWKKTDKAHTIKHLEKLLQILCDIKKDISPAEAEELIMPYAKEAGVGDVLWPLRYALSGQDRSPSPFVLLSALGTDESCRRIEKALNMLK